MRLIKFFIPVFVATLIGCNSEEPKNEVKRFESLNSIASNVTFSNNIVESDSLNYFTFPYMYLGGGVSLGDINNDGLTDIYFTGNLVSNKMYLNKGNNTFEDITATANLAGDRRWYTGTTMADVNNDGFLDIYVGASEIFGNGANQLFMNNGDNTFTEKAEEYGVADTSTTIQSTFFDYDNDGLLDLFVANYPLVKVSMGNTYYHHKMNSNSFEDSGHLYRNNGDGSFTNTTDEAGVRNFGMTLGIVVSDFNNDGFKDLYLSNDFNVPDYLYQNNGDGTFTEISKKAARHTAMFGMGIDAGDINNDGLSDLLQVDMTAEDYKRSKTNMASMSPETFYEAVELGFNHQYMQNSLQMNNGIDQDNIPIFSDISRFANMSNTDWSWGAQFADFDNDGLKDVFISNGVKRDVNNNDVNAAYKSTSMFGKTRDRDYRLMPSTPVSNYAFKNNGDFSFSKKNQEWGLDKEGFSNGFAYGDLDNDGDLDLVINNIDESASIYINQTESSENHYLTIKLKGTQKNPFGIGAKVRLKTGDTEQTQELTLTRGYQSSVAPLLHFGLGKNEIVDELIIDWPNGNQQTLNNISTDQLIEIDFTETAKPSQAGKEKNNRFEDITISSGIAFKHEEDAFDDFEFEPLLPHRNSRFGPGLAVGDINGDGLDDFFVGNATDKKSTMYVQQESGQFTIIQGPWESDKSYEDTGAMILDIDKDGDLDLYVVSGGNDNSKPESYYQDRLYMNTENGFVKTENTLPKIPTSGLKVVSGDYDSDGDLDLFIGGRIIPGKYPYPAKSYILRNEGGKDTALKFTDVTEHIAPELNEAGLVTAALWNDFDSDGKLDLVITGEWMPIRFFKNTGNSLEEVTEDLGFAEKTGWWYSLQNVDLDNNGDMDFLAGNLGLNYKYKASNEAPFEVYANDFDENGSTDIVLSYEKNGTKLPLRGRECSSQQVPAIQARFETFESFANADLTEIYGSQMLERSLHYSATTFAHYWIQNKGDANFEMHPLPNLAQFSSINKFEVFDYNGDEYPDVLLAGNLFSSEIETPRNDAGIGLVLTGNSTGYDLVPPTASGLMVDGEVKEIAKIKLGKEGTTGYLFALNNTSLKLLKLNQVK